MVYDKEHGEFIRFAGWDGKTRISETWLLSDDRWNKLDTDNQPSARNHSNMAYDERGKKTILFGGHDGKNVFGDTWQYTNHKWEKVSTSKPVLRINNGH